MEAEKHKKRAFIGKKPVIIGGIAVFLIAVGIVTACFFMKDRGEKERMGIPAQNSFVGENVITAGGLTSAGMLEETWELDFLETALWVEDNYLSVGDEVQSGTAVFKVSEETLQEARKELEDKFTEAELAYRQGVIDHENDVIDARVTNETAAVNKNYAAAEYDQAVLKAAEQVENLRKQVEEAEELVEEYTASQTEDYYRSYYQVDELYQAYYEHFTLLMEYYEKWDIEEIGDQAASTSLTGSTAAFAGISSGSSTAGNTVNTAGNVQGEMPNAGTQSTSMQNGDLSGSMQGSEGKGGNLTGSMQGGDGQNGNLTSGSMQSGDVQNGNIQGNAAGMFSGAAVGGYNENQSKASVYNMLDELVQEEGTAYKEALENYESAKDKAAAGLDQAVSDLAVLKAELIQAESDYEKALISCQADYQTTLAESENAETIYATTLQSLEETLKKLEDEKEEAKENLALFEAVIGDGYFYTESAGTIVMNGIRKDSYLSGETIVIAYSNPEKVTISASVSQSDIAQITVGDEVYVVVNEYGNYTGIVTQIDPVTQAQSRSSVTYQVTVELQDDVSTLESDLTAYLYFGMTDEMIKQMENLTSQPNVPEGADAENMPDMPDGIDVENMPDMPDGMDAENMPDMPGGMDAENMPDMSEGIDMENMPDKSGKTDKKSMPETKGSGREGKAAQK